LELGIEIEVTHDIFNRKPAKQSKELKKIVLFRSIVSVTKNERQKENTHLGVKRSMLWSDTFWERG
jgi:hypothetical protein